MSKAAFLLIVSLLFGAQVWSQSTELERDTILTGEKIDAISVTAFRVPFKRELIPAPVHLVTNKQLQAGSALTPVDALNRVPGVLMHHGTLNTNRLTVRGIGSRTPYSTNKIKAYFGEIPLTSGDGETSLEDLENSSLQRVEILKGPSSSMYGAGLAGAILVQPKSVATDFVQNQTTVASFGTIKNTLSAGIRKNKSQLFSTGSFLRSNGFRNNNSTTRTNILLNGKQSLSNRASLQALLQVNRTKAFIPSSLDYTTFIESPESAAANWEAINGFEEYSNVQLGMAYDSDFVTDTKLSVAAFASYKNLDELRPFNRLKENVYYYGSRISGQKKVDYGISQVVFIAGLEIFRENYDWLTFDNDDDHLLSDNNEIRAYENLYAQMEWSIKEKLFLSVGINGNLTRFNYIDNYNANGDNSGKHNYKPVLSPRIGSNYRIKEHLSVFGNISHGFSTPGFEETLLPEGDLNTDIKPESGWNLELGIRAEWKNKMQFAASYSRIYVYNLLVARRTADDAYIGVNAGQSLHPGFEVEVRWNVFNPDQFPSLTLMGNATFANYHFVDFVDEENDYSGNLLPGTAKNIWNLGADFNLSRNIGLSVWHRFTGKMPLNDSNDGFAEAFGLTNVEVNYTGINRKVHVDIKGGIQNIFDVHYASMLAINAPSFGGRSPRYYYPGNPRNFFISIIVGWGKG